MRLWRVLAADDWNCVWCMKKTTGADDYFLGGRGLSGPVAALSAQASDMSGWLLMGLPGSVYALGTGQAWIAVGLGLGTIANWLIIAKPLRAYTIVANNSMTLPEFFGNRYHDKKKILLGISSVIIVVFFLVYTASALASGGKLFNTVFGIDYHVALFIGAAVILIYTFMGGFLALCAGNLNAYRIISCSDCCMGICKRRFLCIINTEWSEFRTLYESYV